MNGTQHSHDSRVAGVARGAITSKAVRSASLAAVAALLAVAGAAVSGGPAQAASSTVHGCPRGAVCIYPQNKGWNNGHPESSGVFWSYGPHNLSNQTGDHYVLNNQSKTKPFWSVALGCTGYNGTGKLSSASFLLDPWIAADSAHQNTADERGLAWQNLNLTPVNSVVLTTPSGNYWCDN